MCSPSPFSCQLRSLSFFISVEAIFLVLPFLSPYDRFSTQLPEGSFQNINHNLSLLKPFQRLSIYFSINSSLLWSWPFSYFSKIPDYFSFFFILCPQHFLSSAQKFHSSEFRITCSLIPCSHGTSSRRASLVRLS